MGAPETAGGAARVPESAAPLRRSPWRGLALVLWLVVVPFAAYAFPYVAAEHRSLGGEGVATFTVDEPLYLAEALAIAQGRPATWNMWTHEDGSAPDTYRRFPGSLLPAALGWRVGADMTLGLGAIAGLCAVLASLLAWACLRLLLPPRPAWPAPLLASIVVLLPWGRLGEIVRLRMTPADWAASLPLARPFTSQWGPVLFLLGLLCSLRMRLSPSFARAVLLAAALLAQFETFPYAVPVTWSVYALLMIAASGAPPERGARIGWILLPLLALLPAALALASTPMPGSEEALRDLRVPQRIGGAAVLVLALGAVGWAARRSLASGLGAFLPALAAVAALTTLADHVVPARFQATHHFAYLYPQAVALLALVPLGAALGRASRGGGRALASAVVALALAAPAWAGKEALSTRAPALREHRAWVHAMRHLPETHGGSLLTEGESLDGPGAWAGLFSPIPVLYAYTSEYSTYVRLEDRRWRRAWYHHFRGLSAADVDREGDAITKRYRRVFGAHNSAPDPAVLRALRADLAAIEAGAPEAVGYLRTRGPVVLLEDGATPSFDEGRLSRFLVEESRAPLGTVRMRVLRVRERPLEGAGR